MGLPCLNCGHEVELGTAKLFAECYLCSDCYVVARRLYDQGNNELEQMKLVLKEIIRAAITRKQLALPPPSEKDGDGQLPQPRAVELLVQMLKGEKSTCTCPPKSISVQPRLSTPSSAPTQGVGGQRSSSSSSGPPSGSETPSIETPVTETSGNA